MKKITLIIGTVAAALLLAGCKNGATTENQTAQASNAPASGAIVYFNLDKVLEEYDMANDLRQTVESKAQNISQDLERRQSRIERDIKTFQDKISKGLLVSSVAQQQQEKLQKAQADFQNYYAQKQQEMAEEQQVMMNQIADAIKTFLDTYNTEKGYAMILTTQGAILPAPIAVGDASLDITEEILAGLNAEYIKTKSAK